MRGVVTRGADGVAVAAPDGTRYEGVLYERGRYPVGSGDAFLAGLVVGLERGEPWPRRVAARPGRGRGERRAPRRRRARRREGDALAARAEIREI